MKLHASTTCTNCTRDVIFSAMWWLRHRHINMKVPIVGSSFGYVCKDDSVFESRSGIIYVECFLFDRLRGSWLNCTSTMPMSSFFSCVIEQWVPLYNAAVCVLSIKSVSFFSKRLLFLAWCLQMKSSLLSRYPIWNNWNTTRPRRYSTRECKKL